LLIGERFALIGLVEERSSTPVVFTKTLIESLL